MDRQLISSGSPEDVIRTRIYLVDRMEADIVARIHREVFGEI